MLVLPVFESPSKIILYVLLLNDKLLTDIYIFNQNPYYSIKLQYHCQFYIKIQLNPSDIQINNLKKLALIKISVKINKLQEYLIYSYMGSSIDGQTTKIIKTNMLNCLQQVSNHSQNKIFKSDSHSYFIRKNWFGSDLNNYSQIINKCNMLKHIKLLKSSNIVWFEGITQGNFCSRSYSLKIIEQYYDLSLYDQIHRRRQAYPIPQAFSQAEIIKIYQFLTELNHQYKTHKLTPQILNLRNIKLTSNRIYKYINPIQNHINTQIYNGEFFSPQNYGTKYSQAQVVFSLGMILLSVCLLDNLEQCYNYRSCTFCWSVFEEKIMNLGQKVNQQLFDIILTMIQKNATLRPTLYECQLKYKAILKNINLEDYSLTKNMLTDISFNTIHSKSRQNIKTRQV